MQRTTISPAFRFCQFCVEVCNASKFALAQCAAPFPAFPLPPAFLLFPVICCTATTYYSHALDASVKLTMDIFLRELVFCETGHAAYFIEHCMRLSFSCCTLLFDDSFKILIIFLGVRAIRFAEFAGCSIPDFRKRLHIRMRLLQSVAGGAPPPSPGTFVLATETASRNRSQRCSAQCESRHLAPFRWHSLSPPASA